MQEEEFYLKVAHALTGCQLVEQELKLYITEAFELATKYIDGKMPFKMKGDDYADSSLERLIEIFKRLNDNEQLAKDLRSFKDERNFLSHKGITHCLDYEEELFHETADEMHERMDAIEAEANRLRTAIHEEANKFRGCLWFDDLTKKMAH